MIFDLFPDFHPILILVGSTGNRRRHYHCCEMVLIVNERLELPKDVFNFSYGCSQL